MANVRVTTFHDLTRHVLDYLGATPTSEDNLRFARRAVLGAYMDVTTSRRWSYYYQHGRFTTVSHQTTGTIAYTASTRAVTLSGATWPSWAGAGVIQIANVPYDVASRDSGTQLTLATALSPDANIAAGTTYVLWQDTFTLPADFVATDEMIHLNNFLPLTYQHPTKWLVLHRIVRGPATPRLFTIMADPKYFGLFCARVYPPPDNVYVFDYIYQRRPRQLTLENYNTGTVSITSGSTSLAGSGTTWTSSMVGSVLRVSSSSEEPTGPAEENPASVERTITGFTGTGSMTLDGDPGLTLSGKKYTISDVIDIEEGSMSNFMLRACERQARMVKRLKSTADEER